MAEEIGLPDPSQYGIFQSGTDGGMISQCLIQISISFACFKAF